MPKELLWLKSPDLRDHVVTDSGILEVRLFPLRSFMVIFLLVAMMLGTIAWFRAANVHDIYGQLPTIIFGTIFFSFIISITAAYIKAILTRGQLTHKSLAELSEYHKVKITRWQEIENVALVSGTFSVRTNDRRKITLRAPGGQASHIENIISEKTGIRLVPMKRRWRYFGTSILLIVVGIGCAFLPTMQWSLHSPNGGDIVLYPFLILGYLSLIFSVGSMVYFVLRLETVRRRNPPER